MTRRCILTIDVGTSSTKTALWDDSGRCLAEASQAYPLNRPAAGVGGNRRTDLVGGGVRHHQQVIVPAGVDPGAVAGIGVDGIGWTLLPVDHAASRLRQR